VKSVLRKALGDEKANLLIDRILQGSDITGIESLKWMDPGSVAELLRNEHPQIVAAILVHLDFDQASEVLKLFAERQRNEVLICFPFSGSTYCNKACVWNWQTKLWGLRDLTDVTYGASGQLDFATSGTWAADPDAWDWDETTWTGNDYAPNEARLLLTTTTAIKAFDVGATDDGSSGLPGALQRTGMTLDDPYSMKLVRAVYPRVDGPAGSVVTVRVGAAMNADQSVSWSDAVSFTIGSSIKADSFAQGRFVAVEFSASVPFRVRSFDLDVVATGAY
jgi:hypothetical protein